MPFDETIKGDPFRGDFPEGPHSDPDAIVQRQVSDLTELRYQPAIRHQYLGVLQQRIRQRPAPDDREDPTFTQLAYLPAEVGFDTLLVPGELLLASPDYQRPANPADRWYPDRYAKDYLDALGVDAVGVDCDELRDRVLRLIPPPDMQGPQQLADLARVLRSQGYAASLTNIMATAPVHKTKTGATSGGTRAAHLEAFPEAPAAARRRLIGRRPEPAKVPAKVAVIDTGITDQSRTDQWLRNVPRNDTNVDPLYASPADAQAGILDFESGHGTFVIGIVQGVAPGADIRAYRAVGTNGVASEVTVACAMIQAVKDGADIINMSLSCQTQDDTPPVAIKAALDVIRELEAEQKRTVIIVAAAGNFGDYTRTWPAGFPGVVSVAALAPDWLPAAWSSRGSWVGFSTLGVGVYSTFVEGQESPLVEVGAPAVFSGPNPFAVWSGTSFAAPQIAGALARLYQEHGYSLPEALASLAAGGRPLPGFGQALKIASGF